MNESSTNGAELETIHAPKAARELIDEAVRAIERGVNRIAHDERMQIYRYLQAQATANRAIADCLAGLAKFEDVDW